MKLVFVHDGPIYHDKQGNYYEYSYHGLYERYRYLADEITFIMRVYPVNGKTYNTILPKEVNVVRVPDFKSPKRYFKNKPVAEKILEQQIKMADCAILRVSSCAHIALKYCRKYQIPYIYECVGCTRDALWNHSFLGKIMAVPAFLREKAIIYHAPYVYYVTNKFLQHRYPTQGKYIGCSDVTIKEADKSVIEARLCKLEHLREKKKIIIGTAAALDVLYKGQQYVIEAIGILTKMGYDIEYHLAGSNSKKSNYLNQVALKNGVQDRVLFCGSLNASEMIEYYDSLDIYIQPSKLEGLSRAIIEAMSRGCPVLAAKVGGNMELLQDCCLFKKGSVKAIVEIVSKVFDLDMKKIAIRNFNKSKEFNETYLENKRKDFYDQFHTEYKRI